MCILQQDTQVESTSTDINDTIWAFTAVSY